jgi:hypothetical protein
LCKKDQDEDLDRLGAAIGRQREIGLMIGEELEYHVTLLEETEDQIDRADGRLNNAKKSLAKISRKVKDKSKCFYFLFLILIQKIRKMFIIKSINLLYFIFWGIESMCLTFTIIILFIILIVLIFK